MSVFHEIKVGLKQAINGKGKEFLTPEQQRNKELVERYPFLLLRNVFDDSIPEDYDYSYIWGIGDLPVGWEKLFLQMCEDIRQPLIDANYLDKFRFVQIKEKYNGMSCYHSGAPITVADIIDKYFIMAGQICTVCGKPATRETISGYIASYCDNCINDNEESSPIKLEPNYVILTYENGKKCTKVISFENEWNRYIKSLENT